MKSQTENTSKTEMRRVTHYGKVHFGDVECEAVVLDDGTRGFVQRQLMQAIGFKGNGQLPRFHAFLAETSPNTLILLEKAGSPVIIPGHGRAHFVPHEIVPEICDAVIGSALDGTLHAQRKHLIAPCRKIQSALSRVGIIALIDEATGYQYTREPDALQKLLSRMLRDEFSPWERRFSEEYYRSLFKMLNWEYRPNAGGYHPIIGQITLRWVYEIVYPLQIVSELKSRAKHEKLHQWLNEQDAVPLLKKQESAVMAIANSSAGLQDFEMRCSAAFKNGGLQFSLF